MHEDGAEIFDDLPGRLDDNGTPMVDEKGVEPLNIPDPYPDPVPAIFGIEELRFIGEIAETGKKVIVPYPKNDIPLLFLALLTDR